MARNHTNAQARELTEAELDAVSGGGTKVVAPSEILITKKTDSTSPPRVL
jgi:hypothetical protein